MENGKKYNGFILKEQKKLEEINSIGRIFEHEKTGAKLFHLENDDDNKVFCISFRTPPEDNTGLPHILEHSVLCGSRKYPLKDPFVELAKGSLNTFLNAMTYPDKTMYPVASRNEQDFLNLMDVYMDAVFYPNIYERKEILKQEGWHYELNSPDEDITYKGVVYNEMKGAFSSPEQVLFRNIQQTIYPDTPYAFESGGDPEFIPELTQEQFEEFHKKYYHPSNSYIFIYGDGDINKYLKYIDEEYLCNFEKMEIDSRLPEQKPFDKLVEVEKEYSIATDESDKDKTFLSYNIVVGQGHNPEIHYTLDIIEHILLETPGAPLKQALLDAKIGKDIFGSSDTAIKQPYISIVAKGANPEQKDEFLKIINKELSRLVNEGIDKKEIEAAINLFEFKLREADYGRYPKGLMYCIISMSSWLYDEDPMMLLNYNPVFEKLRTSLSSNYMEQFIEKYLLNNNHASLLLVKPKKGLNAENEKALKYNLNKYKETLSKDEIQRIIDETKHLIKYQQEPSPKKDLEKIPLLQLEDIERTAERLHLSEETVDGVKLLYHNDFTNLIGYVNLFFDLNRVEKDLIPYVGLLTSLLGKMSTENYNYGQLSNEVNINTGGINFNVSIYGKNGNPDDYSAKLVVSAKSFYDKLPKLFELVEEIILKTKVEDIKRLIEIVYENKSRLQMTMTSNGHNVASLRAQSYFSKSSAYKDMIQGIGYFKFLLEIEKDFDNNKEMIVSKLNRVKDLVFNKDTLIVGFTGEEKVHDKFKDLLNDFVKNLKSSSSLPADITFDLSSKNEGFMTSDKIQYVAKAGNFIKAGYSYTGHMSVLKTILSLDYLWNRVRVMGGAYGCMANMNRMGNLFFVSYRDPNLKETINAYDEVYEYIKDFNCDDREMVKYIIGTISRIDAPLTPAMKGMTAFENYFINISYEDIQNSRNEILSTTKERIRELSKLIKETIDQNYLCVQGNEEKIKDNQQLFNEIKYLFH